MNHQLDYSDVFFKQKKKNKILFDRNSPALQPLLAFIRLQKHRTLVVWAFKIIDDIQSQLEDPLSNDKRIHEAIHLCNEWAKGHIKMSIAKKSLLKVHAMAKETSNPIMVAKLHAIGQGLATIHVETHAIGLVIYDLTSIVLEQKYANFEVEVSKRIDYYMNTLNQINHSDMVDTQEWATFLLDDSRKK